MEALIYIKKWILESQQLKSKTVFVDNYVGHGIVNACVNIGLLEKTHGVLDEMNVQGGFVQLGFYVSILKAYGNEHRTTDTAQLVSEMCSLGLELDVSNFDTGKDMFMFGQEFLYKVSH